MTLCCYGCGQEGLFERSAKLGGASCSNHYRQCPVKRAEWASAMTGTTLSAATKLKIGAKSRGRPSVFKGKTHLDDIRIVHGERHGHFGRERKQLHRQRLSLSLTGKKPSEARRQQISTQMSGAGNPRYDKGWNEGQYEKWLATVTKRGTLCGENNPNWNPDLDREAISAYRSIVYRLSRTNWIEKHGCYEGGRGNGRMELDHIVPVSVCFKLQLPVELCSSLINLRLVLGTDNAKKNARYDEEDLMNLLEHV